MQKNLQWKATWSTQHACGGRYFQSMDWLRLIGMAGVILLISAVPTVVFAGAFQVFDHSASATAQGGAFAAQADDPSALYFNPAGITQLSGIQTSVGTLLVGGSTSFTSPSGATTRGDFGGSIASPPPSNFYLTANLKSLGVASLENLSVGIGVVSPFGILYRYPNDGPFATAATSQSLPLIDIKPTLAYKLNDQLSVGLGADIYTFASFWGTGQAVTKFNSVGALAPPGTPMEVNGGDTAAGFNVSLLYTPLRNANGRPLVNVGLVYRSQATLHLDGQFLANGIRLADASTTLVLPQVYTAGIALWPIRDAAHEWKLELDVDYTGWRSVRNLDVHLSNGINGTISNPQNWRNGYTFKIGTEYKWLNPAVLPDWDIALRGGYWYSETPIPDRSFTPTVPDSDQQAVSGGLGLLCKGTGRFLGLIPCGAAEGSSFWPKGIGIDLAYQLILYEPRTVSGSVSPVTFPGIADGAYQTTWHVGSLNLRVNF